MTTSSHPSDPQLESRGLALGIPGFSYPDLYSPARLRDLAEVFYREVEREDPGLWSQFAAYRDSKGNGMPAPKVSDLLIAMARHESRFVARLFGVEEQREQLRHAAAMQSPVFRLKSHLKGAFKALAAQGAPSLDVGVLGPRVDTLMHRAFAPLLAIDDQELSVARAACALLDLEAPYDLALGFSPPREPPPEARAQVARLRMALAGDARFQSALGTDPLLSADSNDLAAVRSLLGLVSRWAFAAFQQGEHSPVRSWISLRFARALDYANLVEASRSTHLPNLLEAGPHAETRRRDGFALTDRRFGPRQVLSEVDYCLYCHIREKDSCARGLKDHKGPALKKNPLGIALAGCPLEEKVSEAHFLKKEGDSLAALAVITIDNPMSPGTGHRICNDCMKACVFQKQEPVNIPQVETGVLTDVLRMPWGVEMFSLLTRFNPIDVKRPYALPYNGKNVLVVGLGPAGYTLSHHLLNEGFGVIAIDGLKIEPLPARLTGHTPAGRTTPEPVRDYSVLERELDRRILGGFGGVAEYGITVRWDKNFLDLLHLTLSRRDKLRALGGVRFGGTLTIEDAWAMGIDHIAIAAGAGKPTLVDIKNNLLRGMRKASDFLMALQLTGAFKKESLANLQVRLPALVIGGGLTAIDATTELAAYYPVQVEKALDRHERLCAAFGEARVLKGYDAEDREILDEFLSHGREIRAERARAKALGEAPDFAKWVRKWGGVRLVYRKSMHDSPAYRLNHEEIIKFFEEGVSFAEKLSPLAAVRGKYGAVEAMIFERLEERGGKWINTGEKVTLPARSVCVAAGTSPNTIYEREHPGTFELDAKRGSFRPYRLEKKDGTATLVPDNGSGPPGFFTSYHREGRTITFYGDNLPRYAGSVVKAMASARDGFPHVRALFEEELAALDPKDQPLREHRFDALARRFEEALTARVERVVRLTPTIVEVVLKAPMQARKFQPGQFYRLQNFERGAPEVSGTRLLMEGMALTGAWTDPEQGLLSLIVLELGGSSRLCAMLKPGEPVVVMGPTGAPTELPAGETVLLAGGGLGNAVLFSIGKALRRNGCRVLYFAGYRDSSDVYKRDDIEAAADVIVWANDQGPAILPRRPQDRSFSGNIVNAMKAYAQDELGAQTVPFKDVTRLLAIGSDRMMAAVKAARHDPSQLKPFLRTDHVGIASINSTMQCMMKEVCAQCLQKHVDGKTGKESVVFSCFNQDQLMDVVDFASLNERLKTNSVLEKQTNLYLDLLLAKADKDEAKRV
jgi:NADPH-dependent glutamate synthase beta subunit-like oxidoreductase/NAD(P)H-flavin reductase